MQTKDDKLGNFPNPLAPKTEKKQPSFGLKVAKAIENEWFSTQTLRYATRQSQIQEWRAYARGQQNIDKYKKLFNPSGDTSFLNLDWSPVAIIPKFVKTVLDTIFDNTFDIEVKAVDPLSLSEREKYKNELVGKVINKDFFEEVKNKYGLDMLQGEQLPESLEEVDIHLNLNFRQSIEIAADIAIRYAFEVNDYSNEIKRQLIKDAIETAFCVARTTTDPSFGPTIERIDPQYFVFSSVKKNDFSDAFYMGHMDFMTVSQLRREASGYGAEWANDEKKLFDVAKQYAKQYGNPAFDWKYDYNNRLGSYEYDNFLIPILKFEYMGSDADKYEEKSNRYGNKLFKKQRDDYKPPKKSKYERTQFNDYYEQVYSGCYVLKSELIYGWGAKENQIRDSKHPKKAYFGYKAYAVDFEDNVTSSLVAKMVTFADAVQMAYLKMQQAIAQAAPDGYSINLTALDEVDIGNGALTPIVISDIYTATGRLYYRSEGEDGARYNEPIKPMPSSLQNVIRYAEIIDYNLKMLREITGIVPELDGQTKRDQLIGVSEIAIEGAKRSVGDISHSIRNVTRRVAEETLMRIQDLPNNSPLRNEYVEAIGQANMAVVEAMDRLPAHRFGIDITAGRKDSEVLALDRDISQAVAAGQIYPEDRYMLLQIKNPKYAIQYLKLKREKYRKERIEEQNNASMVQAQANAQAAQQAEMAKVQAAQQLAAIEVQKEMQLWEAVKLPEMTFKYAKEYEIEAMKVSGMVNKEAMRVQGDRSIETQKEDRKDERSKMEAEQQSELIEQRQKDLPPRKFREDVYDVEIEDEMEVEDED